MKFTISCETFCRLASVPTYFEPHTKPELFKQIECVRIENYKGCVFAISTNVQIAAIEFIGNTTEPDGAVHVVIDPVLVKQCESERAYGSFLEIVSIPEIATASAKTMLGFVYNGNACIWPATTVMDNWREWGPDKTPTKAKGALYLETQHIETLFKASPSGRIVFPEHIDVNVPTILRDYKNPNWVGLFFGKPQANENPAIAATLPEWWRF